MKTFLFLFSLLSLLLVTTSSPTEDPGVDCMSYKTHTGFFESGHPDPKLQSSAAKIALTACLQSMTDEKAPFKRYPDNVQNCGGKEWDIWAPSGSRYFKTNYDACMKKCYKCLKDAISSSLSRGYCTYTVPGKTSHWCRALYRPMPSKHWGREDLGGEL
ncbi:hypothetical protein BDD12DRAFT_28861 [Trichophaea hybrida]|nr:hypothetical protein BDD12DRAFT_28861 [Trichophaea hybrida]